MTMPAAREPRNAWLIAGGLIAVFLLQLLFESRIKSPGYDEPPHIASGLSYVQTGVFRANLQHPPLMKEASGLSLLLAGIRWPKTALAERLVHGDIPGKVQLEWAIGNGILAENGPDRVLFWARLPFLLVACLLGALIYVWGRQMMGGLAALGAVFLFTLDPSVIAHSFLVTMDVPLAAFTMLLMFALWNYVQHPGTRRLVLCGLAIGAALGAKFSAVLLLPVSAALLLAAAVWRDEPPGPKPRSAGKARPNDPCPCGSGRKFKRCHGEGGAGNDRPGLLGRKAMQYGLAFLGMCLVAFAVIQALYFFSSDPLLYWKGLRLVNADHNALYRAFMAGEMERRFTSYFAVAYLLKEPVPAIALASIGLVLLIRDRSVPAIRKLFLLLPPAALFAGHTIWADNLGIRYIMPALPFAHLLGGLALARLVRSSTTWVRYAAAGLCAWTVLAATGVYPDHLSYFNETACLLAEPGRIGLDGGTRCGTLWLDDSNVDWGQGLKQLKAWLDRRANGRTPRLAYFGSFNPEAYGIRALSTTQEALYAPPSPGLYVVSAHYVARVPNYTGATDWLRKTPPDAMIGHALYVYDVKR